MTGETRKDFKVTISRPLLVRLQALTPTVKNTPSFDTPAPSKSNGGVCTNNWPKRKTLTRRITCITNIGIGIYSTGLAVTGGAVSAIVL